MATTTRSRRTRTADADTAPKGLPRDLDESDVIADGQRMADELAAREAAAAAKPAPRRSRKAAAEAAPAQAEKPAKAAPAAPAQRTRKGSAKAAPAQPQQPAQAVEAETPAETPAEDKPAPTPRLDQAAMIVAFLAAHPGEAFSPNAISKAITPEGRKPLGLRDACARLAKADKIAQTSDKPLKYAAK
ncbi:hypothetical protein [Micromonospora aurantiaca (nom. illeg.)]|uniref:hypothetical protein n=1 Tax=Micromonospora aurantiaca (nom. illeg.) TaxID=47850 RepID=UPI003676A48F